MSEQTIISTSLLSPTELRRLVFTAKWGQHLKKTLECQFEAPCGTYTVAIHRGVEEGRLARHKVWLANRGLIRKWVNRINFRSAVIDTETLIQFGEMGLAIAIDRFNPDYGTAFSTYADYWIRAMMLRCIGTLRDIRLPQNISFVAAKMRTGINHSEFDEIADRYGLGKNTRVWLGNVLNTKLVGLDNPYGDDDTYHEIVASNSDTHTEVQASYNLEVCRIQAILDKSSLSYTTRQAVKMRLGLDGSDQITFKEIGARIGYNRERVRQLFNHAMLYIRSEVKILVIDPGKTTGYIFYEPDTHTVLEKGELNLFERLDDLIYLADFVVYESFQLFGHKAKEQIGSDFPACEVIGVIKYLLEKTHKDYVVQRPADQQFFDDAKLKKLSLYSKSRHVNSATKHLLYYLLKCKDTWIIEQLQRMVA